MARVNNAWRIAVDYRKLAALFKVIIYRRQKRLRVREMRISVVNHDFVEIAFQKVVKIGNFVSQIFVAVFGLCNGNHIFRKVDCDNVFRAEFQKVFVDNSRAASNVQNLVAGVDIRKFYKVENIVIGQFLPCVPVLCKTVEKVFVLLCSFVHNCLK